MSIDLEPHSEMHGGTKVITSRLRRSTLVSDWAYGSSSARTSSRSAALLFTYLYLRGVNTDGHWMSLLGYKGIFTRTPDWRTLHSTASLRLPS